MVKNLPAMQEMWTKSLNWEDPLEEGIPVLLPGESHGKRSLVGYSPWGCKELGTTKRVVSTRAHKAFIVTINCGFH